MPETVESHTQPIRFGVHPSVAIVRAWIDGLKPRTGRSLNEWIELIKTKAPEQEAGRKDWLKREHGFTAHIASWLAAYSLGVVDEDGDPETYLKAAEGYVSAMFAGPKEALVPIYEHLMRMSHALGADVMACPCLTMVPLYRRHVFAQIKPSTRARIDLGLALRDLPATGRLIDTGGFAKKDRITHRIAIGSVDEIDEEVARWLKAAYDLDR